MKIQKQVILLMLIIVGEFHCEEVVIGNEGLELPKENQDLQEIIENAHNSPLLSEVNDSELPENPFAVKEKRCPKYRLGSALVGPSLNSNNIDNKNHKLYGAFCKTCLIRNKCDSISDCHLCEKWCTSTSKLCSETDADGDTKGKLSEDEQPKDETVSLANRGSFNNDEEKIKDSIYTITLNRGDLLEIILSLLGMLDTKDVESMTISIKSKEGKPIVLNNEENSLKGEKLGEKLKDLCAFSKKFPVDEEKNPDHEKLHELVQELLSKLRSYSHDDGSPSDSANDDSPAVGSPNNIPGVASRLKDAESIEKVLHQSLMNPDIIEDTPDMSQLRDQRIRTHSGLLESPADKQQINGELLTPSGSFATRKNYEPLNSKDFINIKDQNVGTSFSRNKIFDHNDFEEEAAEEIQKPLIGAASAAKPLLTKLTNTNFDQKPQDVIDRLHTQHSPNSVLNKILDNIDVEKGAEEIQKPLMGAASAAKPLLMNIKNTNFDLKPQEVMDRLRTQHSQNSGLNKIFDHNDVKEGAEEIQKPLMGAASAAGPLLAKMGNTNFNLKPQEVMNRLQSQHSQNSELFNAEGHNVGKVSDAFTLNKIIDHNRVGDRNTDEVQTVAKEAASAAKQFSQFNGNNEEKLGEPVHSLHHPLHHISHHNIPHHHNPLHHIPHHHIPHKSKFLHHHRSSEPNDLFASDGSQQFDSNVRQQNRDNELNSRFNPQEYDRFVGEPLYNRDVPINSRFASQQYDNPVGQPFNQFNNRLVPQQYNNIDQLNSRFTSEQIDNPVGQPINRNNQFNSGFAQQQYNIPVGQTFNNRESEFNPFQQFENLQGQPINRNSQSNSRFVPQMYDRNANVPSEVSRVDSSHKSIPSNADAVKISSKEPSSGDNSLFFHDKENTSDKIGTPTSHSQVLVGSKDPQHNEDLNSDIKHLNNYQKANEDKKDDEVSMPNADLGISSDIFNSIENESQSKQNNFGARASELLKKLKDKQDQRLENQKQQLEKARENILGMVKTADAVKMPDEDKKPNPSKTSEDSKLQSTPENIPNISQNIAAAADTLFKPQSALDKVKELSNSQKQPNINDLTHLFSRNNEDIVGSQPLENSFERMAPDNVPNSHFFNRRPASSRQTLPEEHPLDALNLDSSDSVVGMPTPDVDSRGKFEDTQPNSNSLGKIIPAEKGADISFKNSSDIFFIGNGIKLPLRMATKSDGSVHFTVDIDKLCSCNNTSCPKNHTAKELEQTVEAILEKEAELNNELEDFGDIPLGMAAPNIGFDDDNKEKERSQRETVRNSNFINLKNRIANKFLNSIEDEGNAFKIKRSINENTPESVEQVFETENLSPSITRVIRKGFKEIKKAISNIPKNTQLITTRLLMPDDKSNIMQPTHNIFDSKTLEDNNENVIPISKMYKFKGLEDQLAKKIENIEKTVDNYSKIDDQIFENESAVLNKFNEDPIINKEVGLASDVLGFFKKLAVDSTKHKNL